jgi:hypothetical protein
MAKFSNHKRRKLWKRYDGHCAYCGATLTLGNMTVDHVRPVSKGGRSVNSNLKPACALCNKLKASLTLGEFRERIARYWEPLKADPRWKYSQRFGLVEATHAPVRFFFETYDKPRKHLGETAFQRLIDKESVRLSKGPTKPTGKPNNNLTIASIVKPHETSSSPKKKRASRQISLSIFPIPHSLIF